VNISGDHIYGTNISGVNISGVNISGEHIYGTNISGVNISGDHIYGTNISSVNISGEHIYGTNISGVNISGVNISGEHIYGTNISGVNISGEHIYGTNISGVNISGEHIYGTNISGVNISGDHIYGTTISGAGVVQTSSAMTGDNDTKLATSKAIKEYIAANSSTSDKYVHIYNSGFQTNGNLVDEDSDGDVGVRVTKRLWIPFRGPYAAAAIVPVQGQYGWTFTSTGWMDYCSFIAPHGGIVKKILFRTETSMAQDEEGEYYFHGVKFILCKAGARETNQYLPEELPNVNKPVGDAVHLTGSITKNITYSDTSMSEGTGQWVLVAGVLYGIYMEMVAAPYDMVFCMVVEYTF
jgi:hypothetical protein